MPNIRPGLVVDSTRSVQDASDLGVDERQGDSAHGNESRVREWVGNGLEMVKVWVGVWES